MKVLHGSGKPRLVYRTTNTTSLGNVVNWGDFTYISVANTITDAIVGTAIYGTNANSKETWARITRVDTSNKRVYHTTFSNMNPSVGSAVTSKYTVHDLPYCQNNLIETFTPDFITHRLYNGTISTTIRGWWYSVILDYSRRITADQANVFANLFDKDRDYDVYLYPRLDNLAFGYKVELDPETELVLAQKPFHTANKLFKVKLNGVSRLDEVPLSIDYGKLITEDGDYITTEDGDYIGVNP